MVAGGLPRVLQHASAADALPRPPPAAEGLARLAHLAAVAAVSLAERACCAGAGLAAAVAAADHARCAGGGFGARIGCRVCVFGPHRALHIEGAARTAHRVGLWSVCPQSAPCRAHTTENSATLPLSHARPCPAPGAACGACSQRYTGAERIRRWSWRAWRHFWITAASTDQGLPRSMFRTHTAGKDRLGAGNPAGQLRVQNLICPRGNLNPSLRATAAC
jgi:hypothetical protein